MYPLDMMVWAVIKKKDFISLYPVDKIIIWRYPADRRVSSLFPADRMV
jgi:hypothetical protein